MIKELWNNLFTKKSRMIIYCLFGLCFFCFFLSILTLKSVGENKCYYERDEIALYIYKYGKLPKNFITKDCRYDDYYIGTYQNCFENGYNIGGDNFRYEGSITKVTGLTSLKECDYYPNRQEVIDSNNRGTYRLVYSAYDGIEVFYTEDHYQTYNKLTKFSINIVSNIFKILSAIFFIGDVVYVVLLFKPKVVTNKDKENYEEIEVIE